MPTFQDALRLYALKKSQVQNKLDPELEAAVRELTLTKAKAETKAAELARYEQEEAYGRRKGEESLQNALARQWQRKIEGGANVMKKTLSPEGNEVWTGVWQPGAEQEPYWAEGKWQVPQTREEQLASVPEEARYAYDKYMGIPPEFGQKARLAEEVTSAKVQAALVTAQEKQREYELKAEDLKIRRAEIAKAKEETDALKVEMANAKAKETALRNIDLNTQKAVDDTIKKFGAPGTNVWGKPNASARKITQIQKEGQRAKDAVYQRFEEIPKENLPSIKEGRKPLNSFYME